MLIITPAIKDKVLSYLCNNALPEQLAQGKTDEVLKELEIDFATFNAIMIYLQRNGLIEDLNLRRSDMAFILRTEAHDYYQKGGFAIQEEIFQANLDMLILEIEHLKKKLSPDLLERANKISSIASALISGLTFFKK